MSLLGTEFIGRFLLHVLPPWPDADPTFRVSGQPLPKGQTGRDKVSAKANGGGSGDKLGNCKDGHPVNRHTD